MLALGSALGCVGGISCLSEQKTARLGISVGMTGMGTGLAATLAYMNPADIATYGQLAIFGAGGAGIGYLVAQRIGPTELPEAVAAFHSLVGLAALPTAVGDYMVHDLSHSSIFHDTSLYLGAWMGSITATGSVIAWGKLSENMNSNALQLQQRDNINMALGGVSAASMLAFVGSSSPAVTTAALGAGVVSSGVLGLHDCFDWWSRHARGDHSPQFLLWLGSLRRRIHSRSASLNCGGGPYWLKWSIPHARYVRSDEPLLGERHSGWIRY